MKNFRWQMKIVTLVVLALMMRVQAQPADINAFEATNAALKKMREEKISPQKAWEDGLINEQILLHALSTVDLLDPGSALVLPGEETRSWMQLLQERLPDLWKSPAGLSEQLQVRIALSLLSQRDARGVEIIDSIINAMPRQNPNMLIVDAVLYNLSNYYHAIGENAKAVETSLRIEEFSKDPSVVSNHILQAARSTYAGGDKEGGKQLYDRVVAMGYGWATGHAYHDLASHLMAEGKLEEARALLKKPIEGLNADQIRVLLNQRLAQSYFETAEWDLARQYAKATVDQYKGLANPIKNHGLEWIVQAAESLPQQIDQWQKSPVQLSSQEINLRLKKDTVGPIHTYFNFSSYRSLTAKAVSSDPNIKVWPLRSPHGYDHGSYQMMCIEIGPEAVAKNAKTEIVLTFEELPDVTFRIPITLREEEKTTQ